MGFNTGNTSIYVADNFEYFRKAVYLAFDGYCDYKYIEEQSTWFVFTRIDPEMEMTYRVEKGSVEESVFLSDKTTIDQCIYVKPVQITDCNKNQVAVLLSDDGYGAEVTNRLAVNVGSPTVGVRGSPTVIIGQQVAESFDLYKQDFVKNNGSSNLNIDGSSSSVVFTFDAIQEHDIMVHEIRVALTCQDITMDGNSFCSGSKLSNGVLVEIIAQDILYHVYNITQNEDWFFFNSPQGMLLNNTGPKDAMQAGFYFGNTITLKAGSSDKVRVTIRDDLTGNNMPNFFKVKVFGNIIT
jgi:hypothetical protein